MSLVGVTDCLACNCEQMSPAETTLATLATVKRFGLERSIGELCPTHRRQFERGFSTMQSRERMAELAKGYGGTSKE